MRRPSRRCPNTGKLKPRDGRAPPPPRLRHFARSEYSVYLPCEMKRGRHRASSGDGRCIAYTACCCALPAIRK